MTGKDKNSGYTLILVLATLFFLLSGMITRGDFWVEDEARYAEVTREIVVEGQWLVPHLNGFIYPDKPPLYFWLASLLSLVFGGISPFPFLLINFFAALGLVLVIFYFGRYLFDSRAGFFSALILLSSLLFAAAGNIARMDMLFTLFITLAIFSFYRGYREKRGGFYVACSFFCALAVLTKGPFGLLFVILPALVFLAFKEGREGVWRFLLQPGWLIFILLTAGWLFAAWMGGYRELVEDIFSRQILARAVDSFQHKEPFYYYFLALPAVFLPWFPFLPRAVKNKVPALKESPYALLSAWFFTGFASVSLVSCKIFIYLLPLLPPLALWLGKDFSDRRQPRPRRTAFIVFLPVIFMGFSIGAALLFARPAVDSHFSPRFLGREIGDLKAKGYRVGTFRVTRGILNFYAATRTSEWTRREVLEFFASPGNKSLVIKARDLERLEKKKPDLARHARVVTGTMLNNEIYYLLAGREDLPGKEKEMDP